MRESQGSLAEFKRWKATELRLFLLYTGPIVLKEFLDVEVYKHFLALCFAMRIFLSPSLLSRYLDFAGQLLQYFVECFAKVYGKEHMVYNVHSLLHLIDDARKYGALDNCSAFKFESYLGKLKKLVRNSRAPCAQLVKRVLETQIQNCDKLPTGDVDSCTYHKPHSDGPSFVSLNHCVQYKQCRTSKYFISVNLADSCFSVRGKIGLVRNILKDRSSVYVVFEWFTVMESFCTEPLDSACLLAFYVAKLSGVREIVLLDELENKYVMLPFKHGYAAMIQLHF